MIMISNQPKHASGGLALYIYVLLAVLFTTALVVCNLIANRFVHVDLGFHTFVLSAGVLPYPITFLVTDILSEIYGKKAANRVVLAGFAALVFTMFILWIAQQFPAIENSRVSDDLFQQTFGNSRRVIIASMTAYLIAQFVDVRLFHFWKRITGGKMLWLRNNASTVFSQLLDTTLVVAVLFVGELSIETMGGYVLDGWSFKALTALADTPFLYLSTWLIRSGLGLKFGEEVKWPNQ
ncbi:MAG: hypothetical protein Kow0075_03100 [Salibacteraceae bacterium]